MSKKTRQTVTILVLCVLLVGAGIGYYALIKHQTAQQKEEKENENAGIELYSWDINEIEKIYFKSQKAEMTLVKEKEQWKKQDEKDFPLEQNRVDAMLGAVAAISADKIAAEDVTDLEQYQLAEPELLVQIQDSEGNQKTIAVGKESLAGGGRYAYCDDSSKVYIVTTSVFSNFDYTRTQLMEVPDIPAITVEYITELKLDGKKQDFSAVYDENKSTYKHIYSWAIEDSYSKPVAGDRDALMKLFANFTSLSLKERITYKGTDSELKRYGLKNPAHKIAIKYYEVDAGQTDTAAEDDTQKGSGKKKYKQLHLCIGNQNKDMTGYYVTIDGEKGVFLMETAVVESMVNITPMEYVYARFYVPNEAMLQSIDLKYQGKEYSMTLKQGKQDEETKEYTYTAQVNGKKVNAKNFRNAYNAFAEMLIHAEIDKNVKVNGNETIASIIFHEKEKKINMNIYPYDGKNFYRIEVDGVMEFVTSMSTVDSILNALVSVE